MKVAFITPRGASSTDLAFKDFWGESVELIGYRESVTLGFSSGLLIVAALTPKSFDIKLIDENFETIDFNEKYDLVALSAMTQQATRAYQIADEFRKKGIKVAIGGIHATVLPEEAKQHADSVIVGEAEEIWPRFIEDLLNDNIQPFYRSMSPADLTKSPVPRYDLVRPENYKSIWIQASRGCPHDCEFCVASKVYGFKYRHKTVEQVIGEIEYVKKIWGNPKINFADDNMFVNKSYSIELVKNLIPLKIRWSAQTDISIAQDDNFLELLKRSGCISLFIGFESLAKENLEFLNKNRWKFKHLESYPLIIEKIQSHGIGIVGAFIVGFDNDDTSVFRRIVNFVIDNYISIAQITVLTPLPGTRLRERLKKESRILPNDWEKYSFTDVNFIPKEMSPQQLQNGLVQMYRQIYNKEVRLRIARHFKDIYSNLTNKNK